MSDDDPICVCGVARSEHQLCGCPDRFELRRHPDVVLAIRHREERQRYAAIREREPEIDLAELKADVRELAGIVTQLCAHNVAIALDEWGRDQNNAGLRENTVLMTDLRDQALAVCRRLS